jgi:hypothetical protein
MNRQYKKICTFDFRNGTRILAAVEFCRLDGSLLTYDEAFQEAKKLSWQGDEECGRGGLKGFEIGEQIFV